MPDNGGPSAAAEQPFTIACGKITALLAAQCSGVARALTAAECRAYNARTVRAGWRIPIVFTDGITRQLDLLLPPGVPWQAPRIALVDRLAFLTWPHIEQDGLICIAPDNVAIDPDDPAGVAAWLLGQACELIEKLIRGECDQDFRDEILSYWNYKANHTGPKIISLIDPAPPSREVRIWRGTSFYLIAENEADIRRWLINLTGSAPKHFSAEPAAVVWFDRVPLPAEYPETGLGFYRSASASHQVAGEILGTLASERPKKLVALVGFPTANGPALGGVIVKPRISSPHGAADQLNKGFRPNKVPAKLLLARYFGQSVLTRGTVERGDHAWIHGRGQDERAASLKGKTVAIVGCGSVGGAIAVALAQAGVGHIHLTDFDIMKWENVGRHVLGAVHVGQSKAQALATKLRAEFPHISVEPHLADMHMMLRSKTDILDDSELIISATGSWPAETALDFWQSERQSASPIVYAWTEAHACAGHAVLIPAGPARFRDGFDATGRPNLHMTAWPTGSTEHREPACGAVYQPYGPIELGFINCLASELVLDALLGTLDVPLHRVWFGSESRLKALGGEWSPEAIRLIRQRPEGRFVLNVPWAEGMAHTPATVLCA